MDKKYAGMIAIIVIIIILAGLSVVSTRTEKQKETEIHLTGIDLTYLDDTEISEDVYAVNVCGSKDCE